MKCVSRVSQSLHLNATLAYQKKTKIFFILPGSIISSDLPLILVKAQQHHKLNNSTRHIITDAASPPLVHPNSPIHPSSLFVSQRPSSPVSKFIPSQLSLCEHRSPHKWALELSREACAELH